MRIFDGTVRSIAMKNSAVVEVERRTPHPLYRKLIRRSRKFIVDTTGVEVVIGQKVKIIETRPMSKNKYFKIASSVKEAKKVEEKVVVTEKPKAKRKAAK